MFKRILAYLQFILPINFYTLITGKISDIRIKWFKNWQINKFIRRHKVDISKVFEKDINKYSTLNSFFIRRLDPKFIFSSHNDEVGSPAEAIVSQFGKISRDTLVQAKNKDFTLKSLLANDQELAANFIDGSYIIFFLQPHHYHRFHMPLSGHLIQTTYVPGKLFAVDFESQCRVENLYAKNERYITVFNTEINKMVIVLIGALSVGRIQMQWQSAPLRYNRIIKENPNPIYLEKNEELGFFQAGSTIILLFEPNKIHWKPNLATHTAIEVGQAIGNIIY